MRGSDDANVDMDRLRTPDSLEFRLLQDPQKVRPACQAEGHLLHRQRGSSQGEIWAPN